jgi:hypothetical protein
MERVPEAAQKILAGYITCENRDAVWQWMSDAAENIVDLADRRPAQEMAVYQGTGERAYCPLCGGGALGPRIGEGFSWPEGLRRHLLGNNNSQQCGVMWAAKNAAIDASESEDLKRLRLMQKRD